MRRRVVTGLLPELDAEPAYLEFEEVREQARRSSRGPIGSETIGRMEEVAARRGGDWCTAVLGRRFPGIRHVSTVDGWMLIVADTKSLEPPLPPRIVEERQAAEERRVGRERAAAVELTMAKEVWRQHAVKAPVPLTVRENTRHTGVSGSLRHVVAAVDLVSGRSRRHNAGMGLCETPERANPLQLGGAVDLPPTCTRCQQFVAKVRTLDEPAPPTAAEAGLLKLIDSGVVLTLRPTRGQPTIRDTSQRSHGVTWGHLGRKVDTAVTKLQAKGWVQKDEQPSKADTGQHGQRWRLTDTGTAALEA
ncbi:hypothetical protein ACWD3I_25730 [Streptomyces sp. NPDC002817]|uniref:hypothetical protein n=1 Tax=Streptomyces sp. NPDC088357 TaxID=3154655 RepID=UPI0034205BB4